MADNTIEPTTSSFSHEGDETCEGGRINSYPTDRETTWKKCNVALPCHRDSWPGVRWTKLFRTEKSLVQVGSEGDGESEEVPVDVQFSYDGWTTDGSEEEPDQPDTDSSDGRTIWHLREDAEVAKGTRWHWPNYLLNSFGWLVMGGADSVGLECLFPIDKACRYLINTLLMLPHSKYITYRTVHDIKNVAWIPGNVIVVILSLIVLSQDVIS